MFRRPSKTTNLRTQLGNALKAERLNEALDLYELIEKQTPDEPRWSHRRGDLLQRMGRKADEVLADLCRQIGIDPEAFFAGIADPMIKDRLRANTDELIARGGFGSPTIFIDQTDMYFGNDSLPLVRAAILRRQAR